MKKLEHEIENYSDELEQFIRHGRLSREWFDTPDHAGYRAYNTPGFESFLRQLETDRPGTEEIIIEQERNRRSATAFLAGPLAVGQFGEIKLLEIIEPTVEEVGNTKAGLEHVEFYYPDFKDISVHLLHAGFYQYREGINSVHTTLNINLGSSGQLLRFTNRSLADLVKKPVEK